MTLSDAAKVFLYGVSYSSFYVGSNGYITFDSGDSEYGYSLYSHFSQPRISGWFSDLYGGTISWKQLPDRAVVTYQDVICHSYWYESVISFQIEMFFNGVIRITYLYIDSSLYGISGISKGGGIPDGFAESDLSAYPYCSSAGKGDADHSGAVEITDAMSVLKVLSGTPADIDSGADVNGDRKIGQEEVIFILRKLAEDSRQNQKD
ncbi:MAG: hypothetical protein BWK80_49715 [Desulfobacteraceae bacterium IS3]|nr:MAG: hypothetical protein BWK80_49715 [Desulfobacteraceae bacterium IS3]